MGHARKALPANATMPTASPSRRFAKSSIASFALVKPNRLTRAKLAIDDFAKRLDGDAVGIVAFAGSAFLACPITLDYAAFHETLDAIDTNTNPRGGTNI